MMIGSGGCKIHELDRGARCFCPYEGRYGAAEQHDPHFIKNHLILALCSAVLLQTVGGGELT